MKREWLVHINNNVYEITYICNPKSKEPILKINGKIKKLPKITFLKPDIDFLFEIEGHRIRLLTVGKDCDLAVDDVFQTSGRYYNNGRIALWGKLFIIIYILQFLAVVIIPLILFQAVSVWSLLAIPLTLAAIYSTLRLSKVSFLLTKKLIVKPIAYIALLFLYIAIILFF